MVRFVWFLRMYNLITFLLCNFNILSIEAMEEVDVVYIVLQMHA